MFSKNSTLLHVFCSERYDIAKLKTIKLFKVIDAKRKKDGQTIFKHLSDLKQTWINAVLNV